MEAVLYSSGEQILFSRPNMSTNDIWVQMFGWLSAFCLWTYIVHNHITCVSTFDKCLPMWTLLIHTSCLPQNLVDIDSKMWVKRSLGLTAQKKKSTLGQERVGTIRLTTCWIYKLQCNFGGGLSHEVKYSFLSLESRFHKLCKVLQQNKCLVFVRLFGHLWSYICER